MSQNSLPVRTRFAPSPTGYLHLGGARTALYCWLQARAAGGEFVLRIEDTDRERSTPESVQAILDGMRWLGLDWDEGPHFQSKRQERYQQVIDGMLEQGQAYRCYCSRERIEKLRQRQMAEGLKPRYDGHCRDRTDAPADVTPVVRFRNPGNGIVEFADRVRGTIRIDNAELDDLVIQRADGSPTYNFSVVVDDIDMDINLVIRGDDHINNTPRQINIYRALGAEPPEFAHVPMILGEDGARLSKRHGAVGVMAWREMGFLPDALINYLVRLGWSHGDQEVFSREELVALFRIDDVNRKASVFNAEKLRWLNQHYLRTLPAERVEPELKWHLEHAGLDPETGPAPADLLAVQGDRVHTLTELVAHSRPFFDDVAGYDPAAAGKHLKPAAGEALSALLERLKQLESWTPEPLGDAVRETAEALGTGMGKVAQPLRVALMGNAISPSIDKTLWLVGRERSLVRIERALEYVHANADAPPAG